MRNSVPANPRRDERVRSLGRARSHSLDERIKSVRKSVRTVLRANSLSSMQPNAGHLSDMERRLRQLERLRASVRPETQVFGRELRETMEGGRSRHGLPEPMYDCIAFLNSRGLAFEGLYRIPGSKLSVDVYQAMYDSGRRVHFGHHEEPNTVASLLLAFVRQIPGGLFSSCAPQLRDAARTKPRALELVKPILAAMPEEHRACVGELMRHLSRVAAQAETNKMTPTNLATCIFPTMLGVAVLLITHCDELFPPSMVRDLPPPDDEGSEGGGIREETGRRGPGPAPAPGAMGAAPDGQHVPKADPAPPERGQAGAGGDGAGGPEGDGGGHGENEGRAEEGREFEEGGRADERAEAERKSAWKRWRSSGDGAGTGSAFESARSLGVRMRSVGAGLRERFFRALRSGSKGEPGPDPEPEPEPQAA